MTIFCSDQQKWTKISKSLTDHNRRPSEAVLFSATELIKKNHLSIFSVSKFNATVKYLLVHLFTHNIINRLIGSLMMGEEGKQENAKILEIVTPLSIKNKT